VSFDIAFVRQQFPQLKDGWAYFDNAGGTLVPRSVGERMAAFLTECQVQPKGAYHASAEAARRLDEAKRRMAELVNATPEEIVLGHSTTMNVYVLAQAIRESLKPGDEIIVTNLDHEANNGAWRRLEGAGAVVKEWRVHPDTADLEIEDLKTLLSSRTKIVAVSHCSNITGTFNDVAEVSRLAHEVGAIVVADGVAAAPHRRADVKALGVDVYLWSLYKFYGPHHALMYVNRDLMLRLKGQNHFFIAEDNLPLKLNVGGYDFEMIGSLTGIADYVSALHERHFPGTNRPFPDQVAPVYKIAGAHELETAKPLFDYLSTKKGVRLVGRKSGAARAPVFAFTVAGHSSKEFPPALAGKKIGLLNGHYYAHRLVDSLGLLPQGGVVRASLAHYNSADEVQRLITALDALI
jgi:cysteine desulfurase family protein (TIGR01976 family)